MTTAVLINRNARRGSAALESTVRQFLPEARLATTRSLDEARRFLEELRRGETPDLIVSGGGDGTAVSLLNDWEKSGAPMPTLGLVPLGTGNGWARMTGSPPFPQAMRRLAAWSPRRRGRPWPTRSFALVEVEGVLSPWAGTGWDAEIVSDYQQMIRALPKPVAKRLAGFPGYMLSLFGRTVPRMAFSPRTHVRLVNLGSPALAIDEAGRPVSVRGGDAGAVLYEGPVGVAGCGTTTDLGLGFRAFPFAESVHGRMECRVYGARALEGAVRVHKLWRGEHPLPDDAHFLVDACRMEFDRPVNFEIGGDVVGTRTSVEFRLAHQRARLLDWRRLAA